MEISNYDMSSTDKISVLLANYNNGVYIKETLDSILAQSFSNIEIVIVDDCSTDNSLEVIARYQSTHTQCPISVFKNDANRGCGYTKRRCIELSSGDYYVFIDPDDVITPDCLDILYRKHQEGDYSIVYATHYFCDAHLNPSRISDFPGEIAWGQSNLNSRGGHISAPALCKRSCYDLTEGINPDYQVSEDHDMYCKMEEIAPVRFVNKALYYYRGHDHNTSWNPASEQKNSFWGLKMTEAAYYRRKRNGYRNISWGDLQRKRLEYFTVCQRVNRSKHDYWSCFLDTVCVVAFSIFRLPRFFERAMHFYRRKILLPWRRQCLKNTDFSLLCNNCNGSFVMHDLGVRFNTPTINLYIIPADYVKMLQRLDHYMASDLQFFKDGIHDFPVARLDDIVIYFMHYHSEEEAAEKWYARRERINKNNLFVLFSEAEDYRAEDIVAFDQLPYTHKLVFTQEPRPEIASSFCIPDCKDGNHIGPIYLRSGRYSAIRFMERFNFVKWFNSHSKVVDPKIMEFLRFCVVGGIATVLHYGMYWALLQLISVSDNWWTNVAYSIGYLISWFVNLWLTAHFTFKTMVSGKRGVGFALSHLINYGLHIIFLNLFIWMGLSAEWAPILVYSLVIPINFFLVRLVFTNIK